MKTVENYPRIALLLCDHVSPHLRHIGGNYPEMFQIAFPAFVFDVFDVVNGDFPASALSYDAFMVTGSRHSVYDRLSWISDLKELIKGIYDAKRKFIGVCFGHQILAEALGGRVLKSDGGWCVGYHSFEVLQPTRWMLPTHTEFKILMSCQDQVASLPPGAKALARGSQCENGLFAVDDHMVAIQGHPEFTPAYMRALIHERRESIGNEKADQALNTLAQVPEINVFEAWMRNFILAE